MPAKAAVAVCGIGRWGRNLVREFARLAEVAVVFGVGDRENRKWMAEHYPSIPIVTDTGELFRRKDVSAVIIATPPDTHVDLALAALRHDKHVFVEKPLASEPDQVAQLYDEAAKRKLCLFVGHIFLHHPVFDELVNRGAMSLCREIRFDWHKFGSFGDSIVSNLFIHDLAIAQKMFGPPVELVLEEFVPTITDADRLRVKMHYGDGRICYSHINRASSANLREVHFEFESDILVWNGNRLFHIDHDKQSLELEFEGTEQALTCECRAFLRCMEDPAGTADDCEFEKNLARSLSGLLSSLTRSE